MKRLSIFSVLILGLFCVLPTFAETAPAVKPAEDVYIFTTPTTEVTPVAEEPETKKVAISYLFLFKFFCSF